MVEALFIAVGLGLAIALVVFACTDTRKFLFVAAMLLPIVIPPLNVGVSVSWYKVILPVAMFGMLIRHGIRRESMSIPHMKGTGPLYAFLAWVGFLSVGHFLLQTHRMQAELARGFGWGTAQTTFRLPVQMVAYLLFYGVFIVGAWYVRNTEHVSSIVNGYLTGVLINAVSGLYQVFAARTGLPWLPSSVLEGGLQESGGQYQIGHHDIFRLSGLAGEPKHAAAGFVIALFLILAFRGSSALDSRLLKSRAVLGLLILALLLTMSTSGWLTAVVVITYSLLMEGGRKLARLIAVTTVFAGILVGALVLLPKDTLNFLLQDRITSRVDDPGSYEYKDFAVVQLAQNAPRALLFGQGAGGVDFLLMPYVKTYQLERGTITPTYLITQTAGDAGVLGIILVLSFLFRLSPALRDMDPAYSRFARTGVFAALLLPRLALPGFFMIIGAFLALAQIERSHRLREVNVVDVSTAEEAAVVISQG